MDNPYRDIDRRINGLAGGDLGFTQLLCSEPRTLDSETIENYHRRYSVIQEFFSVTIDLFRASIAGQASPEIFQLLLNEVPDNLGFDYHARLPESTYRAPVYFRTDQCSHGRLVEIQCPGSMWGDHQLLWDHFSPKTSEDSILRDSLETTFPESLSRYIDDSPRVLHLLDNASSPQGVRYFIARTLPKVEYFGYTKGLQSIECNFIRSHSFFGLLAENLSKTRISNARETGSPLFDLPPNVIFDQKIPMALPFDPLTRDHYSDQVRELFPYTAIVRPEGVVGKSGNLETLENFANRPLRERAVYLKYAGCDVSRNWGSRTVSRLSKDGSEKTLRELAMRANELKNGIPWIIQDEELWKEPVSFLVRDRPGIQTAEMHAKYSAFYGPFGLLGLMSMHRQANKVHGQLDTVANICVEAELK